MTDVMDKGLKKIGVTVSKPVLALITIIQDHIETARHSYHKLLKLTVRVPASLGPSRDIVKVIYSLDFEWDMPVPLNKGQIPTRVSNLRQLNDSAFFDGHFKHLQNDHLD